MVSTKRIFEVRVGHLMIAMHCDRAWVGEEFRHLYWNQQSVQRFGSICRLSGGCTQNHVWLLH